MKSDTFSSFHPTINFLFFGIVFAVTMFVMHPVIIAISFISALVYAVYLDGKGTLSFCLKFLLPVMFMTIIINPAFSHEGMTILRYLPSGNPLTLESILYGVNSAFLLGAVMLWFRCYTAVMTSDKFIYLFGRIIPSLSLVLSMTLRFVPKFKAQLEVVRDAQQSIGRDVTNGRILRRIKNAVTIISIMITWSLENAIETADSMKSRGYGLKGRTAFSIYRFDSRDKTAFTWLVFSGIALFAAIRANGFKWRFYPNIKGTLTEPLTVFFFFGWMLFCMTPVIINRKEDRTWRYLRSKI